MATQVNPPRGMRDFLPAEKARRERVLSVIRSTYRAHGFDEIETPVVEDSDRLHAGLGGDNEKLAFGILKRGLTIDDFQRATEPLDLADLGLRFDLTVPLARFYASHHADLPRVFRSIQIAPVWRAERPQKGRYRQFVQCDIDIIGEKGPLAEVELIQATTAAIEALGIRGATIRINDRRILTALLTSLGFPAGEHAAVLITIDKLDKIGPAGVVQELRDRFLPDGPVDALDAFLNRPITTEFVSFGERAIRKLLPADIDPEAIADLVAIADGLDAATRQLLRFDPFLVRGMGYYTGAIFEVAHPELGYSLGGGGRYDGMIGRFLGQSVPATGFSLGFERLVDLVELDDADSADAVALLYDDDAPVAALAALKAELVARGPAGTRVRLERRLKRVAPVLDALAAAGFTHWASVTGATASVDDLELKPLA
ncbi:histidine--tRNA ligase [Galbitalea sp. SE-J8]|uniref:histidine--tRNA ligase n=1 Tax=Galbitalea sp. SE-J8 TaxID=3054952 RepID=UPI00259D1E0E|nr:histidine--tRNA ligase [Galbitalea sp. SE-J8]MDM4762774.1 histidine--tRNA ligase [Galbitalea sp. SE-J8]